MMEAEQIPTGHGKRERREERRRAAHRRRVMRSLRRVGILAGVLLVPLFWMLERSGDQEMVRAEVAETRLWRHSGGDGTAHTHTAATLRIEGLSEVTLDRADQYERGERVAVWVRRGRISGWPYFLDLAKPGEIARETASAVSSPGIP